MAERNVSVRLGAKVDSYVAGMRAASAATTGFSRSTERNLARVGGQMQNVGRKMTTFVSLPIVAAGAFAVKAAVDWESAWAGVTKTVDGTAQQLAVLEQGLRDMSKEVSASHSEIAAVAEAAGALGVETDSILEFTRVMVDLGETTDLTSDQAATAIAKMMNVMQSAPDDVDNLGAALVHLGNNGASTESQILDMSGRIAAAGAIVGLNEAEVLGFANALASMGIEAEAGGSAFSRVISDMSKAVSQGGDELDIFAQVAGVSAASFAASFREDPASAIVSFIDGLAGIHAAGGDVFTVLDNLGLGEIRVSRALLSMATSGDVLTESLAQGEQAWEANSALADEAAKRYDTAGARFEMVRNKIVDLFIDLGEIILPVVESVVDVIGDLAEKFQSLPAPLQMAVGGLLGLVAAMGPTVFIAGSLIKNLSTITAHMPKFGSAMTTASKALGALGLAATVGFIGYELFTAEQRRTEQNTRESTAALDTQFNSLMAAAVGAAGAATEVDALAAANEALSVSIAEGNDRLADAASTLNVSASEILDVLALMDADSAQLTTTLDYLARSFGLSAEQADFFATHYSSLVSPLQGTRQWARDLGAELGITSAQFDVLTGATQDFLRASDESDVQQIARDFLDARVEASTYGEELVRAAEAQSGQNRATGDAVAVYRAYATSVGALTEEQRVQAGITDEVAAAMAGLSPAFTDAAAGMGELETVAASSIDTMTRFQEAWAMSDVRINAFSEGLERALGTGGQWIRAHDGFQSALLGFNEQIEKASAGVEWNTDASIENQIAQMANRDAVLGLADDLIALTESNIASGMSQSEVTADYLEGRDALLDAAEAAGLNRDEVEDLITTYGLTPELISTTVQLMGHALAEWRIQRYIEQLDQIDPEVATQIEAAIDAGDMVEAQRLLNSLSGSAIIRAEVRPKAWRGTVSTNAGTSGFTMGISASAQGRYVRAGTNMVTSVAEPGAGDEVILPLDNPGRMAALLGMSEVGPRVAAALGNLMPAPAGSWSAPPAAAGVGGFHIDKVEVNQRGDGNTIEHELRRAAFLVGVI